MALLPRVSVMTENPSGRLVNNIWYVCVLETEEIDSSLADTECLSQNLPSALIRVFFVRLKVLLTLEAILNSSTASSVKTTLMMSSLVLLFLALLSTIAFSCGASYLLWTKAKQLIANVMMNADNLLDSRLRSILGETITNLLRSFLIIISGRHGILISNSEWYQIIFGILYFFSPIDLIPDFLPIVGYFDDAFVVYMIGNALRPLIELAIGLMNFNENNDDNLDWIQDDDEPCIICFGENGIKNTIFAPCGHMLCEIDAQNIMARGMNCPFCRRRIVSARTI